MEPDQRFRQPMPETSPQLEHSKPLILSALADFIPGYRIRRRQFSQTGSISIIRKRDIVRGHLNHDLEQAHLPSLPASQLLRDGDVILRSHYGCFTAVVFDVAGVCMTCAAPLIIIRIRSQAQLLPEYLAWYLQSSEGQQALTAYIGQGTTEEVAIEGLHGMALPVPPAGIQGLIGGIHQLYQEEQLQAATAGQRTNHREAMTIEAILLKLARLG